MLMRRFPILIDQDFDFEEGGKETMLEKLAAKLEKTKLELETLFADLQRY